MRRAFANAVEASWEVISLDVGDSKETPCVAPFNSIDVELSGLASCSLAQPLVTVACVDLPKRT